MTSPHETRNETIQMLVRMARVNAQAIEKEAAEKGGQDLQDVLERIPVPLDELSPEASLEVLIDVLYSDSALSSNRMAALCQRAADTPESTIGSERYFHLWHAIQYASDRAMLPKATRRMIRKRLGIHPRK